MSVTCDGCGACCLHLGTPPFVSWPVSFYEATGQDVPADDYDGIRAAPAAVQAELTEYLLGTRRGDGEPCFWFDETSRKCRHYEFRPTVCREAVVPGD